MQHIRPFMNMLVAVIVAVGLTACDGGGDSSPPDATNTNCVLGTSTIGNCKI